MELPAFAAIGLDWKVEAIAVKKLLDAVDGLG